MSEARIDEAVRVALTQGVALSAVSLAEALARQGIAAALWEVTESLEGAERRGLVIRVERQPGYEDDPESAWPKWRKVTQPEPDSRKVLTWEKPPQAEPYEKWAAYQSDDCPPGNYVPNMSDEWRQKWKAKMLGKRAEGPDGLRVEIRKTVMNKSPDGRSTYAQALLVAWVTGQVVMSMNGKAVLTEQDWQDMHMAVLEAREAMAAWRLQESRRRAGKGK